jgi:DNA-binding MarR family transcriptional regulator
MAAPRELVGSSDQAMAWSIGKALTDACAVTDRIFAECVGNVHGLRRVEFTLLQQVATNPGVSQKRLCRAVGVSAPQLTLVLDRLLKRGLIERRHVQDDKRLRCIELTCEGHELAQRTHESLVRGEALALPTLSRGERAFLCELLLRIAQAGAEENDRPRESSVALQADVPDVRFQSAPLARSTLKFHRSETSPSLP